jgi:hypothetical protein
VPFGEKKIPKSTFSIVFIIISGGGGNNEHGLEGEDIILECGGWNQGGGCSWDTPYSRNK